VYAKTTPIVLSDLQSLIGRRTLDTSGKPWISVVSPARDPSDLASVLSYASHAGYDFAFHAMRQWSIDLMLDLEASGLILHRTADNHIIRYNELSDYSMTIWGQESPILRPW
jgi:hypothetical protein